MTLDRCIQEYVDAVNAVEVIFTDEDRFVIHINDLAGLPAKLKEVERTARVLWTALEAAEDSIES